MPKLESPFKRQEIDGRYVCIPKIKEEYRWIFENSIAVDKLDGTNVSVEVKDGKIVSLHNRLNPIEFWAKKDAHFVTGVIEAIARDYFPYQTLVNGRYFGELIGRKVQANPYKFEKSSHLWMPFNVLQEKSTYKFWQDILPEFKEKSDQEIYEKVSNLFKGLWSLYKRNRGIKGDVTEASKFHDGMTAEGIVFYSQDGTKMAKLRRDMFDWYTGNEHNPVRKG